MTAAKAGVLTGLTLALLVLLAPMVTADDNCTGHMFNRCLPLDTTQVVDLRGVTA